MADDKFATFATLYNEIGRELGRITGGDPDGAYLYAEVEEGATGGGVFKDEGKQVRYYDPSWPLLDLLDDLWHAEDPDKRWRAMEFSVTGNEVHATFVFPEDFRSDHSTNERRQAALRTRYGNKPIIYPPIPDDFMEFEGRPDDSD